MKIAIIGCGLMGRQRARAAQATAGLELAAVYDPDRKRCEELAAQFGCRAAVDPDAIASTKEIDAVVVAVPHYLSYEITKSVLECQKHVLCEKPLGITAAECRLLIDSCPRDRVLATGFNYRFYPGLRQARKIIRDGAIGELTHIRGVLGHGGRPGMEKEWKMSKQLCGGGALLDPGIHVLDLVQHIAGPIEDVQASLTRTFWPVEVEDNAFLTVRADGFRHAQLHISTTEWKSRFSLDFLGTDGEIRIRGRSGFYGPQVVHYNRRWEWQQPDFREEVTEYPGEDTSFEAEMQAFADRISGRGGEELATGEDCLHLLALIEGVYETTPVHEGAIMAAAR
jgi:predicted dehydrogenase